MPGYYHNFNVCGPSNSNAHTTRQYGLLDHYWSSGNCRRSYNVRGPGQRGGLNCGCGQGPERLLEDCIVECVPSGDLDGSEGVYLIGLGLSPGFQHAGNDSRLFGRDRIKE